MNSLTQNLNEFFQHHWQLWLALLLVLVIIAINEWVTNKKQAKKLSPQEAVALINNHNATIIDIRETAAFQTGHIIESIHANTKEAQTTKLKSLQNKPIILVCARGQTAMTLGMKLRQQGYTQVYILNGGILAWQNAGLPLVKK